LNVGEVENDNVAIGRNTTNYLLRLGQSNQNVDPLNVDRVEEQKQFGSIGDEGLTLTVPSYSITYCRCYE